jgi:hypothetical protein
VLLVSFLVFVFRSACGSSVITTLFYLIGW